MQTAKQLFVEMAERDPGFNKFISSNDCFDRIEIAPGYVAFKQGMLPNSVILRDKYRNHWRVQVEKLQNTFFFTNGWKKFVDENHVDVGDWIVFFCYELNVFNVAVFGHDSCEKEGLGGPKTEVARAENLNEVNIADMDVKEDEKRRAIDEFDKEVQNPNSGASGKAEHGQASCKKTKAGDAENIFRERKLSPPNNPYFVTKIRRERRNQMLIPAYIIKKHNLQLPKNTVLQDAEGRVWNTELTTWEDGRKWYFGGWFGLCRENSVKKDDLLACEFAEETGNQKLYLKVQILRA